MSAYARILLPIAGYAVTLLLIRWVILSRKREPGSAIAWIMAIIFIPILGGVLFLLFGINSISRRREGKIAAARNLAPKLPAIEQHQLRDLELTRQQTRLATLIYNESGGVLTGSNAVEIISDTHRTLRCIEEAIRGAQQTLDLEYYIWQPDRTGTRLRDLLIERAKSGVKVRFLYDSLGSMSLHRRFLAPMTEAGIQVVPFLPGSTFRERWSFNNRCHRKIVVVDGKVGFTGGMNIGDEYLGANPEIGHWRDTHLRVEGPAVWQLQQVFAEDWYYSTGEELVDPILFPPPSRSGQGITQVVSGGPDGVNEPFHTLTFAAINEARESITIATSYFAPTVPLIMALETAAARGVKIRLMIAGNSVYPWTVWVGRSFYDSLLRSGVEIYEYKKGILHSKTITIDGVWSLVGTANFDYRSMLLNFEVALALYGEGYAKTLEEQFTHDLEACREIHLKVWENRALTRVFIENVCRLMAPLA
ncbi:MAG: cardiolipin synthase [Planctomycetaceae bacterium]